MRVPKAEAESRNWTLHIEYKDALKVGRYDNISNNRPHMAIPHIPQKWRAHQLEMRKKKTIIWQGNEKLIRRDFWSSGRSWPALQINCKTKAWLHWTRITCWQWRKGLEYYCHKNLYNFKNSASGTKTPTKEERRGTTGLYVGKMQSRKDQDLH